MGLTMAERCKTKIIATLGNPSAGTYKSGIQCPDLKKLDPLDYDNIIKLLVDSRWPPEYSSIGADVIRLNLAHMGDGDLPDDQVDVVSKKYREIKDSVARVAKETGRRLSILADIPGPKIRIKAGDDSWYAPTDKLTIALGSQDESFSTDPNSIPSESTVLVNIGNDPFHSVSPDVAKSVLKDLEVLTRDSQDEKPLAYIGDNDCTLFVDNVNVEKHEIYCTVHNVPKSDRLIRKHKGFTVRGVPKPLPAFTPEDARKLGALLTEDLRDCHNFRSDDNRLLAFIGISFCQSRDDVQNVLLHVAEIMKQSAAFSGADWETILAQMPSLIAKIETNEGAQNIDKILDLADGAMIARGDLALEAPMAQLPTISKNVMNACHMRGKPVIVATQMLESMKKSIECTRPEATDVFNAIVDGADALLLSGETSSGQYPAHAIRKMRNLASSAENFIEEEGYTSEARFRQRYAKQLGEFNERTKNIKGHYLDIYSKDVLPKITAAIQKNRNHGRDSDADELELALDLLQRVFVMKEGRLLVQPSTDKITHAACLMAADETVAGIIAPTTSGRTARMLARFRPKNWIYAQPHSEYIAKKLAIVRGIQAGNVLPVHHGAQEVQELMVESASLANRELRPKDCAFIFTCGTPLGKVGTTNLVQRWDPHTLKVLCEQPLSQTGQSD